MIPPKRIKILRIEYVKPPYNARAIIIKLNVSLDIILFVQKHIIWLFSTSKESKVEWVDVVLFANFVAFKMAGFYPVLDGCCGDLQFCSNVPGRHKKSFTHCWDAVTNNSPMALTISGLLSINRNDFDPCLVFIVRPFFVTLTLILKPFSVDNK